MLSANVKTIIILTLIMSLRIFNLSMMLPIFTEYASHMCHSNDLVAGLAIGIYGLMQGILQIPFGMLSDKLGRKPVILLGLFFLLTGSIICTLSNNITLLIIGRALQGSGAIGSSILAFISDLTHERNRIKAMAFVGISIGLSFCLSIVIGPILHSKTSLNQIFLLCTLTTIISMLMLLQVEESPLKKDNKLSFRQVLNSRILFLGLSVFFLHSVLASLFNLIPVLFNELWGCSQALQGILYCSFLILSFLVTLPVIYRFKKEHEINYILFYTVALISFLQLLLYRFYSGNGTIFFLISAFFIFFNLLESLLPSMVSKVSSPEGRGSSMGVYSSCQFLGIFFGSVCGNTLLHMFSIKAVFLFCSFISCLWLVLFLIIQKNF